jgi:hypothetical protein
MEGSMNDSRSFVRLLLGLGILALLLVAANVYLGSIPVLGNLPGDFELDYPGGFIYLPFATSVCVALLVTLLASVLTTSSKNDH